MQLRIQLCISIGMVSTEYAIKGVCVQLLLAALQLNSSEFTLHV